MVRNPWPWHPLIWCMSSQFNWYHISVTTPTTTSARCDSPKWESNNMQGLTHRSRPVNTNRWNRGGTARAIWTVTIGSSPHIHYSLVPIALPINSDHGSGIRHPRAQRYNITKVHVGSPEPVRSQRHPPIMIRTTDIVDVHDTVSTLFAPTALTRRYSWSRHQVKYPRTYKPPWHRTRSTWSDL